MQHVDEGILHAYLDGALDDLTERREVEEHVKACTTCAGALAQARRVRDRAVEILSGGAAALEVPPFEQVLGRRSRRAAPGGLRRLRVIGLAATLVLGVGVVWFARGSAGGAGVAGGAGGTAAEAAERQRDREAGEEEAVRAGDEVRAAHEALPRVPAAPSTSRGAGEAERRQEDDQGAAARDQGLEARAAKPAAPPTPEDARESNVVTDAAAKAADADRFDDSIALRRLDQPVAAAAAPSERGAALRERGGLGTLADSAWIAVQVDSATAVLGRRPAVVPDLPVIAYGILEGAPSRRLRVLQALGDGTLIELFQSRIPERTAGRMLRDEGANVDGLASFLPDSAATVRIERDGYEIIGRANLPAESLRVLVGKVQ